MLRSDKAPTGSVYALSCGCEAKDAGWFGRLTLTGRVYCGEASAMAAELAVNARGQAAILAESHAPTGEAAKRLQSLSMECGAILRRLQKHVEDARGELAEAAE